MPGNYTGIKGAFRQPGQWGRSEQGNFTVWVYRGSKAAVYAQAASFAQTLGLAYDVQESFGMWELRVHFPWSMNGIDPRTDKVENWEFFASKSEKDLLDARVENPNTIGALTQQQVEKIRFFIQNPPDGKVTPFPAAADFVTDLGVTDGGANAFQIYQLENQGVRNFPLEQPILKHTIITSNQYAISYALFNIRRVISTLSLVAFESIPNGLLFNLPNDLSTDPTRAYGWYKGFPTIQQVALLKWQISQEFQYGLWSTLIWNNPL